MVHVTNLIPGSDNPSGSPPQTTRGVPATTCTTCTASAAWAAWVKLWVKRWVKLWVKLWVQLWVKLWVKQWVKLWVKLWATVQTWDRRSGWRSIAPRWGAVQVELVDP
jgi:hypothetical protein